MLLHICEQKLKRAVVMIMGHGPSRDTPEPFNAVGVRIIGRGVYQIGVELYPKYGIIGLTCVTALEAAEHGVTCNAICPSYVRTPLVEKQIVDQARIHGIPEEEVVEKIMAAEGAIHRLLEPEEVANFATYLCTNAVSDITGSAQTIDCGWTAH